MPEKSINHDFKIDPRKWGWKIITYWWLFVISLGITVPVGQAYLRYSTPKYMTKSKLLIKGVKGNSALSELSILSEGLGMDEDGKDLLNEIEILKSRPILAKVVDRLDLNISYFRQGRFRDSELYKDSPILIADFKLAEGIPGLSFFIEMGYDKNFQFSVEEGAMGETHRFGEPFENGYGTFLLKQSTTAKLIPGTYQVNIMPVENVANGYKSRLFVEAVGNSSKGRRLSSVLEFSLIDPTPRKAQDILNTLIVVYNEEEISDKTQVLKNTVTFVDTRITELTQELDSIESNIEGFKSQNNIITETAASSLDFSLTELRTSMARLAELELEKELLLALEENLSKNPDSLIPINVSGDAPALASLIAEFNALYLEKMKLAQTVSDEYPLLNKFDDELNELRALIYQSLQNQRSNLQIPLDKSKQEIAKLRKDLTTVPGVEKGLIEKLRLQSIKENLYLFLLQKKEETELSMAISTANTRVIESARSSGAAIFPNRRYTRLGSILLGLFIPIMIIVLLELSITTIDSEDTLKSISTVPVIGRIASYDKNQDKKLAVKERSVRAEMFKLLRTNLNFLNIKKGKQVFVVTSSMSGEGKSITAVNLGITIALSGKKVVLVDMDLRKPKIAEYLGESKELGITNYLMGDNEMSEVLKKNKEHENFYFISSGPVPPNPAELIMSDRTGALIEDLKKDFDFIIIDCPPIGVVSDGLLLRDYLTNMLYVVRHKKTKKEAMEYMEGQYLNGELISPQIIINDIKVGSRNRAYGGYASGYGGGYYTKK